MSERQLVPVGLTALLGVACGAITAHCAVHLWFTWGLDEIQSLQWGVATIASLLLTCVCSWVASALSRDYVEDN
jgi:hypothetical protein